MASTSKLWNWLAGKQWYFILGAPLLLFALAPFPGCGMIFPIRDALRGHPQGTHGTQPQNLVGFWIRDETVMYDFLGQAFYLMPDGRFAGMAGMTERRWHYDDDCLFVDAVSHCGNCYRGNVTTELTIKFAGADQIFVASKVRDAERGIGGNYRKVEINDALKSELSRLKESRDEGENFKARTMLRAIEQFELMSKVKSS